MGTRGAYGLRKNGKDKITYNHFDSYPDGLGLMIVKFIKETSIKDMNLIFDKLIMVKESGRPAPRTAKLYEDSLDQNVGNPRKDLTWYNYLRKSQGCLGFYKNKKHKHMIDSAFFLKDSLFCEFAYIINLDTNMLEFYEGFNKDAGAAGRYSSHGKDGYAGVKLLIEIPIKKIQDDPLTDSVDMLKKAGGY